MFLPGAQVRYTRCFLVYFSSPEGAAMLGGLDGSDIISELAGEEAEDVGFTEEWCIRRVMSRLDGHLNQVDYDNMKGTERVSESCRTSLDNGYLTMIQAF